jgi:hypothetical protein
MRLRFLLPIVFIFSIIVEMILEHLGKVDSIGLWYTLIVATVYTVVLLLIIYGIKFLVSLIKN